MQEKVKLVRIEWKDSSVLPGWRGANSPNAPGLVTSVGYVIEETPEHITLTTSISNEGAVLYPLTIPKGCIDTVTEIAVSKRRGVK